MNTSNTDGAGVKIQGHSNPSNQESSTNGRSQRAPVPPRRDQSPKTLRDAVEGYLQKREQKVESEQLSERTFATDRRSLNLLLEWMEEEYGEMTVEQTVEVGLRRFKDHRGRSVSPTTVAKNLRHIKSFFSDLSQRGIVNSNPVEKVDIPKSRRRDVIPTPSEFDVLKQWVNEQIRSSEDPKWIHLLMKLACNTGMRLGELIQIKWERGPEDVGTGHSRNYVYLDEEEKTLTIKFKRKLRVIPVEHVWDVFEIRDGQSDSSGYVFASPNGGHYDDSYVCRRWKKEARKVSDISRAYTCHSIRHAVVTSLLRENYSAHKVGQLVGHSSEQITERYAHLIAGDLNDMVGTLSQ